MTFEFPKLSELPCQPTAWLWQQRIPMAGVTIIDGFPSSYKTTLMCDLSARITTGRPLPGEKNAACEPRPPKTVLILNAEDGDGELQTRMRLAGADMERVRTRPPGQIPCLPNYLFKLDELASQSDLALVVIDPLASFASSPLSNEPFARFFMDRLTAFSQARSVAVVGIRHWTKETKGHLVYRAAGSHAITAAARSELVVVEDPRSPQQRILAQHKSSLGNRSASLIFAPVDKGDGVLLDWRGESPCTCEELLKPERDPAALNEASELLSALLGDGPLWAKEVQSLAKENGVSMATLRRAKEALKVTHQRKGFGKSSKVYWNLPPREALEVKPHWDNEPMSVPDQGGDEGAPLIAESSPQPSLAIATASDLTAF